MLVQVSDTLRRSDSYLWQFRSLQLSLLLCCFIAVVGGAFFLATALFIEKDRRRAETYDSAGEPGPGQGPRRPEGACGPVTLVASAGRRRAHRGSEERPLHPGPRVQRSDLRRSGILDPVVF